MQDLIARAFPYLEDLLDNEHEYKRDAEKWSMVEEAEEHQHTIGDLADLIAQMREAIGDVVGDGDKEPVSPAHPQVRRTISLGPPGLRG